MSCRVIHRVCRRSTLAVWLAFFTLFSFEIACAVEFHGRVTDRHTGEPVPNATVRLVETGLSFAANSAGEFVFEKPSSHGVVEMVVRHVGYRLWRRNVDLSTGELDVRLKPIILPGQEIIVTSDRAMRGVSPVAFDNLTQEDIRRAHHAQDIPMLLTEAPNVYAYSDNGNGIGYSYLSIRGFPQRRVSVLINGVPLNDPESHEVYWADLPDLAESIQDAQIQRGVGTTLYGSNSIGGTINLLTNQLDGPRQMMVTSGFGAFGTRKHSVSFQSGLIDDRHSFYGRFSRIVSDGYRQNSWSDLFSYFLAAVRYDGRWTNRLNIFGGPEKTHLAYKGIPRRFLEGDSTFKWVSDDSVFIPSGDPDVDRRFNPFRWEGETDNFNQPQYQLLTEFEPNDNWKLENTLYYIKGKGFFDQFRTGRDFSEFQLNQFTMDGNLIDKADFLVRRRWVENDFWGIVPRATRRHRNGTATFGLEYRQLFAEHWAQVQAVRPAPPDFVPGQRYYDYDGRKLVFSAFVQEVYTPTAKITLTGAVQTSFKRYELRNDEFANLYKQQVEHKTDYTFVSPRFGVTVRPTKGLSVFGSVSYNAQEPNNDEIFDPQDFFANAGTFFKDTTRLSNGVLVGNDPVMRPEKLIDFELGASVERPRWRVEANVFYMDFQDEIVYNGRINDDGIPFRVNAPSSIHQGIEFSARVDLGRGLSARGNFALNDNSFDEFIEFVPDWANWVDVLPIDTVDRAGNAIAGFPENLFNLRVNYDHRYLSLTGHVFHAGMLYIDNSNDEAAAIQPYTVVNLRGDLKLAALTGFPGMTFFVHVNNVFNHKYETGGYFDDGFPLFLPAATRNVYAGMRMHF